jgi:hypothetical protein
MGDDVSVPKDILVKALEMAMQNPVATPVFESGFKSGFFEGKAAVARKINEMTLGWRNEEKNVVSYKLFFDRIVKELNELTCSLFDEAAKVTLGEEDGKQGSDDTVG